jgi:hypothetical protein
MEYQNYSKAVDVLGDRIQSASKQFDVVATTRTRQLTKYVDKIKDQNIIDSSDIDPVPEIAEISREI